jgi:hypothetical protein
LQATDRLVSSSAQTVGVSPLATNRRLPASQQPDSYWGGEAVNDEAYCHADHDSLFYQGIPVDCALFDHQ